MTIAAPGHALMLASIHKMVNAKTKSLFTSTIGDVVERIKYLWVFQQSSCFGHEIKDVPKLVHASNIQSLHLMILNSCLQGSYNGGLWERSCFKVYCIQNSIPEEEMYFESPWISSSKQQTIKFFLLTNCFLTCFKTDRRVFCT